VSFESEGDWSELPRISGVVSLRQDGRKVKFTYTGAIPALVSAMQKWGIVDLSITDPPLEEVFLSFYGQGAAGSQNGTRHEGGGER
jgi:hypothetical protein